ncbi:uncharacterized protein ldlrad2 [Stigmatopora argus]
MMEIHADAPCGRLLMLLLPLCFLSLHGSAIDTVNVVDFCGQTIRGDGMIINSHQESKKYYFVTIGTDCHLTMQATSPKDKAPLYNFMMDGTGAFLHLGLLCVGRAHHGQCFRRATT